jgi:non-ribosomal peptide synthetase component F
MLHLSFLGCSLNLSFDQKHIATSALPRIVDGYKFGHLSNVNALAKKEETVGGANIDHGVFSESDDAKEQEVALHPLPRLHYYFEQSCDRGPEAVALQYGETTLSYAELDKRSNRLAHYLHSQYQLQPGAKAAIVMERSVDMYVALLSVLKCGAAFVPIDPSVPSERVEFVIEDSEASILITTSTRSELIADVMCTVIFLDKEVDAFQQQPDFRPTVNDLADDLCYIIYTSGKQGKEWLAVFMQHDL